MSGQNVTRIASAGGGLVDDHGRSVSYLRLSVTDRCNLRCRYCHNPNVRFIPHGDILRYEELLIIADLAASQGIHKVRLTGGEPLVRKGFVWFLEQLRQNHPELDLRLTTNATLLPGKVATLAELGVTHINISLDTLNPATYADVTGRDLFHAARAALDEVMAAGLTLKVNAVAMRGVNDTELADFVALARDNPLDLRFIEFMPMGDSRWSNERYWSADDILARSRELAELTPVRPGPGGEGPARVYAIGGGQGRLGLITPMSNHFCTSCNRLRVTPDGRLRTCLFSDREYRLRPLLRHPGLGPRAVLKVMRRAGRIKPLGYKLLAARKADAAVATKRMSAIGG